jgi:uncharacterized protein YecT (DUF1311 family)
MSDNSTVTPDQLSTLFRGTEVGGDAKIVNRFSYAEKGQSTYSFDLLQLAHKALHLAYKSNSFAHKAKSLTALLAASLFMSGAVFAHSATAPGKTGIDGIRTSYSTCLKAAGGVTPDMQDCIGTEYDYQDNRLNRVYKALMARLSKTEQAKLCAEERKWIAHRDAYCALPPDAGQGQRLESNGCTMEQTAKRAAILEARSPSN